MSVTRVHCSDEQIEQMLRARCAEGDRSLLEVILAATKDQPQRSAGWLPRPEDRRLLTLLAATLLLAALAGAIALAGRTVIPAPEPQPGPEGGWIVYVDNGVLYLTDLSGGEPEPILNDGPSIQCPAFSPDGRLLAYVEGEQEPEVVVVALGVDGVPEEQLRIDLGYESCPRWSPDGRSLAFAGGDGQVWVASLSGEMHKFAVCPRGGVCPWNPMGVFDLAWTYDGSGMVVLGTTGLTGKEGYVVWCRLRTETRAPCTTWRATHRRGNPCSSSSHRPLPRMSRSSASASAASTTVRLSSWPASFA
jgi:hypothetical protein